MIDFHSHILWEVDDGALDYNETLNMLKEAKNSGFKKIISTSHYKEDRFEIPQVIREEKIKQIATKSVEIYLGSEIYLNEKIFDFLDNNLASVINKSKYILIEFSLRELYKIPSDIITLIVNKGYIPVIAHPERYPFVQMYPCSIKEYINKGALLQSNYGSILGIYGNKAKVTFKYLLSNHLVTFLGSDAHRENTIYPKIPIAVKKIKKIISDEEFELISSIYPQKVLNNEELE